MTIDSESDSTLRRDGATVAIIYRTDGPTTPPTIAKIVRRHDGGTTLRVRVVGQQASTLVLVREVSAARWATRAEVNAAMTAATSKTPEQTATPAAMGTSFVVRPGAPTAPTSRDLEPEESSGRGSLITPLEQRATSGVVDLFTRPRSTR